MNVWTPTKSHDTVLLPVMVFIFGGGFFNGYTSFPIYGIAICYMPISDIHLIDGARMVKSANNTMLFVSINYRLNIFGFLNSKELVAENATNLGLLDQEFALKWIQRYIHAFGGDPKQVTLYGESAGASKFFTYIKIMH